jgi:superfamily II helicase
MSQSENDSQAMLNCCESKATLLPVCSFCNQVPDLGIKDVIKVGKAWLCRACELKIILTEVGSSDYGVMMEKMRKVWK